MFCPHCGIETTNEVNYCKRCGGGLNPLAASGGEELRPAVSAAAAWAVGTTTFFTVVGGLIVLFAAIAAMSRNRDFLAPLVWMALFGALTILGSVALLMNLWMRLLGPPRAGRGSLPRPQSIAGGGPLGEAGATGLPPPTFASVTEHTTRTFQPADKNRAEG